MNVIPSGSRRKMEAQEYLLDLSASSVIDNIMIKVADTLQLDKPSQSPDITPGKGIKPSAKLGDELLINPEKKELKPELNKNIEEMPDKPGERPGVNDVMNQSNTLPGQQSEIMIVDINGAVRDDEQGKLAKQILSLLAEKGFTRPGTFTLKQFDLSNGIQLSAIPKTGPAITKA